MSNLKELYKAIPTLDKVILFSGFIVMMAFILFTTEGIEPLPILAGILAFSIIAHFVITKTYSTSALFVLIVQVIIVFPVSTFYAFADNQTFATDGDLIVTVSLSFIAIVGISYITAWGVWKYSSGRYWVKLALAYIMLDFAVPLLAYYTQSTNFTVNIIVSIILVALVAFPWRRVIKANKIDVEIPYNLERKDVTESVKELMRSVEGVEILPSGGKVVSFIAKKGKTLFHVSVLGLNRELTINNDYIRYGNDNLMAYLYQTALDAKSYSRRTKNIPVVINYSDDSANFIEVNSSFKADEKRVAMPVAITTPIRLLQIIKEA